MRGHLTAVTHRYLIALGSNQRHHLYGSPRKILRSALEEIADAGCSVEAISRFVTSRPVGPSQRSYVNAAAIVASSRDPHAMLTLLQAVELSHGRQRRGQRWRSRTLDLDIVLWSGGTWKDAQLTIPHSRFREREFVLRPAAAIAPRWRDPRFGVSLAQMLVHLRKNPHVYC